MNFLYKNFTFNISHNYITIWNERQDEIRCQQKFTRSSFHAFSLYKCVYCLPEHNIIFGCKRRKMVLFGCVRAAYINLENYVILKIPVRAQLEIELVITMIIKMTVRLTYPLYMRRLKTKYCFWKIYEIILPSKSTVPDWSVSISAIISLSCSPVNWSSNAPRISRNDEIGMNPLPETMNYDNYIHTNFPCKEFLFIPHPLCHKVGTLLLIPFVELRHQLLR